MCEQAGCPNIYECWEAREATFLIGGDLHPGLPVLPDPLRQARRLRHRRAAAVAHAIGRMGLRFAVITGVARDDLEDGGAWLFAESVRQVRALLPTCGVEVLIPDFRGQPEALRQVTDTEPDVLGHNVETVPRSTSGSGPGSPTPRWSCWPGPAVAARGLRDQVEPDPGHGRGARRGPPDHGRPALGRGRPADHHPVPAADQGPPEPAAVRPPEEFAELKAHAEALGFAHVESGALVRSSYHAGEMHKAAVRKQRGHLPAWATADA